MPLAIALANRLAVVVLVFAHSGTDDFGDPLAPIDRVGIDRAAARIPVRFAPRAAILESVMVNLVQRGAVIAVGLEMLRKRDGVRQRGAEMRCEVPHPRGIGPAAGHQRTARGTAYRLLAIRAVEDDPARGEPVNVRAADVPLTVTAEFRPQII